MPNPRLLAIDDSATLRKLIEISFQGEHVDVDFADSGAAGKQKAELATPDLILLDFILPDMRGPEFAAWCAKHPQLARVPLLIMSAKSDDVRLLFMGEPMVIDFIPKPFTSRQIVSYVSNILDRRRRGELLGPLSGKRVRRVSAQLKDIIAQTMYARMRPQLARLPHYVQQLGENDAAPFLARKLLTPRLVDELLEVLWPLLPAASDPTPSRGSQSFQGQLGRLPLLTLLSMLASEEQSGILTLIDESDQRVYVYLQWGDILCVTCNDPKVYARGAEVALPLIPAPLWSRCEAEQRSSATPIYVTLCDAGVVRSEELPALLARQGKRLLADAVASSSLRFIWAEAAPLPSYVLTHGQPLFLGQLTLEMARSAPTAPGVEQRLLAADTRFARCPEFSKRVRRFELTDAERRVLALADGQATATELAARARLEARDAARVLLRLSRVGLLEEHAAGAHPEGPVLIADPEFSALRGAVEHMLTRRAHPVALREVSLDEDVCAAIADAKPRLVVINASLLPEQAFKVAEARRSSATGQELTMVAIVDGPQKELVQQLVSVGFDSILVKPMLASELEKVLVA